MKRFLALGIAMAFVVGLAATSFAMTEVEKVEAYGKSLSVKLAAAKKEGDSARVAKLMKMIKDNNTRLAALKAEMGDKPAAAPAPAPAPSVVRPAPAAPSYASSSAAMYEISAEVGYVANGYGLVGTVSMPTILNEIVSSLGLSQIGIGDTGLAVGAGYISGQQNTSKAKTTYAPLILNGIISLYSEPDYSIYAEGGLNFPVGGTTSGLIGGQVAIGADWSVPELGGKINGEVGWSVYRRAEPVGTSSGVLVNAGYKFAF